MRPETAFGMANGFALLGWLVLIAGIVANRAWLRDRLAGLYWPLALSLLYGITLYVGLGTSGGGFSSLAAVRQLFASDWTLLAGWVHYLAFDLFVGAWIARESERIGLSRWLLIPILPLTFLFGPLGLLLFGVLGASFAKGARP